LKLELFDFIDKTLQIIDSKSDVLNRVADELDNFFTNSFFINDHFLNVNYRIKSSDSLKEKILRHNLYILYNSPEELVDNLSDLIGFRIECRFIKDEEKIYKDIIKLFDIKEQNGYFSNPLNSSIMLKLDEKQPQIQKNGFEIYKIDGKYSKDGINVNFELQIKSMVNVFWGDIDHRVLYKNFNYMITEDFFRDIMSSIKDNLGMIDRQLMLVYNHLNDMDTSNAVTKRSQLKSLLSKVIHDIYITKVRQELGFVIDFKKSTDVIVDYIFVKSGDENSPSYSNNFIRIINRLNEIGRNDIKFDNYIVFERDINYKDEFSAELGNTILKVINRDFKWNLFFKILFEIQEDDNTGDFEGFIEFLEYKLMNGIEKTLDGKAIDDTQKDEIISCIKGYIIECFRVETNIELINSCNIKLLNSSIVKILKSVNTYEDWLSSKAHLYDIIVNKHGK
jgi:ppGpp synthetase/RelA/SpoT-type nucleotidyltranferase